MPRKFTKLEGAVWTSFKHRRKHSPKGPFLYDTANTFAAALDNARHHNNQHRPRTVPEAPH
jgi:hypothetical protein